MKLILCWIVALIAGIIFLPDYEGGSFRNIPLFIIIVSVALILTLIKILRYVLFVQKIKKQLIKNGYNVTQTSLVPNLKNSKCYHLSGEKDGKTVNIYIAKSIRMNWYTHGQLILKMKRRQSYISTQGLL